MSHHETWKRVIDADVADRRFVMEESGTTTEGKMKAIVVDEADGYVSFIDSNDNQVAGCAHDVGRPVIYDDGKIRISIPYMGELTIYPL
jgi:thymidine phosphorylase